MELCGLAPQATGRMSEGLGVLEGENGEAGMLGLKIVPHTLAREVRTEFRVTRWMTRDKKRKNWRVLRVEIDRPGCYQMGDTLYMHPELVAKLPNQEPNPHAQLLTPQALWSMYAE